MTLRGNKMFQERDSILKSKLMKVLRVGKYDFKIFAHKEFDVESESDLLKPKIN